MTLQGVVFLAADTARSSAYAQAMVNSGLSPQATLLFGMGSKARLGQAEQLARSPEIKGVFTPTLGVPLREVCEKFGTSVQDLSAQSISDQSIRDRLTELQPKLVIYSGFGGELVPGDLCKNWKFLHLHSGYLPEYRGSTTCYYSLLAENRCGVSAIYLSPDIDTGDIVAKEHYAPPTREIDIDYIYDSAIRADLLVKVLKNYAASDGNLKTVEQDDTEGQTFYVIHPVLKNIAIEHVKSGEVKSAT
ncbi:MULTISPECIES: formyltransferase family protein [Falsihalocynthiibacter]|uniref:formyltransferase family protein n=1 Tax=Falsihalocynthiibacter TaxID=2854182 RepID=UPI003002B3D2